MTTPDTLQSIDARTGQPGGDAWDASTPAAIDAAVAAAAQAADAFAARSAADRAGLLRALADALESQRETLVPIADRETALGPARLNGELDRTAFQLRGFATELERGAAHAVVDDPAVAGAPPAGRPHLTRVRVPVGPVAMFSASNFPFAFSVLGGDTASALAAGCPVVVKAHPAHPELSRRTARLARQVVAAQGLPEGVFQFVEGGSVATGVQLVQAPAIAAVAFTGSFKGGTALARVAAERPRPIPFYGELGSVNPLVALPAALQARGTALAETLAGSICLGAGQFCTSPGVIVVRRDAPGDAFVQTLADKLQALAPHAMLSAGIRAHFDHGVSAWKAHGKVRPLVDGTAAPGATPRPFLAEVQAVDFIADAALHEEVFGSAALVVRTGSARETIDVLRAVGGSLTVTLWGADDDTEDNRALVRAATQVAGRVLFAGVPTGVAVTAAQHHGGPYPASTAPFTTSVGYAAMDRFLRPVALQDAPGWLAARNGVPC
ncbi:aldehyde dehydrogenase (NADP(+)) [Paracidovorax citrulli]|uniref:aldehyde dehydrogenase (NADP(+)) n=1 Tax=Paracidovorax citrulli TaxID=80869 RepID=UPI0006626A91|nr:aldehyde dehydrogenase (NADP(+)) [Paracidovorax citrulli]QCX10799.1 NADP-dependent fatty aldehyde dehydrogenase [Paracidovorax citrulli]UEG46226.1 aldehyde dehydrogenase (NADP(+)) [Paracidovorax citrulli]UMT90495.1 aldehyde dehydrogenase (NADP(+)) [Paracidovorax citrulli]UMT94532.1 aldehyde dehydrogenase (NADP(+)) [Paracidovorax citrulli]WIY34684.1 aldehyde dehydrogenase (NADP(+)) [Paracidovorax citrulli]